MIVGIFDKIEIKDIILKVDSLYTMKRCNVSNGAVTVGIGGDACLITRDFNLCGNGDIILVNADSRNDLTPLLENMANIVTYGLNHKTCVTASSISEAEYKTIQFCIQRSIPTASGNFLEPQEFPVRIGSGVDVCTALVGITAALICDFDVENIKSSNLVI